MTRFLASQGILNKVLYGEAPPEVQPLPILYTIFGRKGTPFVLPTIDIWYPFHIPNLELYITFGCCKCTVFKL